MRTTIISCDRCGEHVEDVNSIRFVNVTDQPLWRHASAYRQDAEAELCAKCTQALGEFMAAKGAASGRVASLAPKTAAGALDQLLAQTGWSPR